MEAIFTTTSMQQYYAIVSRTHPFGDAMSFERQDTYVHFTDGPTGVHPNPGTMKGATKDSTGCKCNPVLPTARLTPGVLVVVHLTSCTQRVTQQAIRKLGLGHGGTSSYRARTGTY